MSDILTEPANNTRQSAAHATVVPKEQLTAFERWELPSFEANTASQLTRGTKETSALTTVAELENLRQQAHDEGFTQGHDTGYAAGIKQARDEAAQLHTLMQNFQGALNQVDEQIAQSLLDLSLEVARQMVRETLLTKPEVILKTIGDAIGTLPHFNQNAHLVLHPDDVELVRKQMGEQLSHAGWKIFTDTRIQRGGCRVETSHSNVDATVEARWKRIVESIGQDKSWQA
ncbi:MAG TPA: flagellar assembly protein FliH [Gallionella sp.]|jgi:flagellar assembly protein FliH|nr:flagellar assembly protein FliH [Gallionella sp.]